jgi:phosphatidylserine/phosphatidylglycerophosphate/cardiolipin synthase-like enzyme
MMSDPDPLTLSYADNQLLTVGARLSAEIEADPRRLWVASGYFAPSVWQAIGQALEKLEEFRLLLGKDFELANLERGHEEARIADLVRQAIRNEAEPPRLITRDEADSVASLVAFLERHAAQGEPVVQLWEGEGFLHAKAYILRGSVGIGSANFTGGGLTRNRELVTWRQDRQPVAEVSEWFERYWQDPETHDCGLVPSCPRITRPMTCSSRRWLSVTASIGRPRWNRRLSLSSGSRRMPLSGSSSYSIGEHEAPY